MERDIDAIVATFPIVDMAVMLRAPEWKVREIVATTVVDAIDRGGSVEDMRKVMQVALARCGIT